MALTEEQRETLRTSGHEFVRPRDLSRMSIRNGMLYWDGSQLRTKASLSAFQKWMHGVGAFIAFIFAFLAASAAFTAINKEFCWYKTKSCLEDADNNNSSTGATGTGGSANGDTVTSPVHQAPAKGN